MSNINRYLDKIFQIYREAGVNDRYRVIFDTTYLLYLKSLEDFPNAGQTPPLLDNGLKEESNRCKWSVLSSLGQDKAREFYYGDVVPFLNENSLCFRVVSAEYRNNILLSDSSFYLVLHEIERMFTIELDGERVNANNIVIYADIYETLLGYLVGVIGSPCFSMPRHLERLMCELLQIRCHDKVYNPNMGCGSLLIESYKCMAVANAPKYRVVKNEDGFDIAPHFQDLTTDYFRRNIVLEGDEKNKMYLWLSMMNFYFHQLNILQSQFANFMGISFVREGKYDKLLFSSPANLPVSGIFTVLGKLNVGGKAAFLLPKTLLYNNGKKSLKFRQELLNNYEVEAVISLPDFEMYPAAHTAMAIVIVNLVVDGRSPNDNIWFCQLKNDGYSNDKKRMKTEATPLPVLVEAFIAKKEYSNEWFDSKNVLISEVKENENSLLVELYIDDEDEADIMLDTRQLIGELEELRIKINKGLEELTNYLK